MIYNATEFMEVPWETLIKGYRDALGKESRATVREYVDDFLAYIFDPEICTDEVVERNTLRIGSGSEEEKSMKQDSAKKDRSGSRTPLSRPPDTGTRSDKEIRQQAVDDARRSFSTVRDLLSHGVGPNAGSTHGSHRD
jgi:hypothetical protein